MAEKDIITRMLSGKPITEKVETELGVFEFKIPKAKDEVLIEQGIALRCGGQPREAYSSDAIFYFRILSTLVVVTVSAPEGWSSAEECEDMDFIGKLYGRYLRLRYRVFPPGPELGIGDGNDKPKNSDAVVGGGAFSGASYRQETPAAN